MKVLWETGPTTVQGVHTRFQEVRPLAFNTVQTVLSILHRKGKVKRALHDRAYVYRPAVSRDAAAGHALRDLIDRMFQSRPEELVLSMVRSRHLTLASSPSSRSSSRRRTTMGEASRLLSTLALNATWQLLVVVAAAAAADLLLRRAAARTRHALWAATVVLGAALPLLAFLPRGGSPVRPAVAAPRGPVRPRVPGGPPVGPEAPRRLSISVPGGAGLAVLALLLVAGGLRGARLLLALRRADAPAGGRPGRSGRRRSTPSRASAPRRSRSPPCPSSRRRVSTARSPSAPSARSSSSLPASPPLTTTTRSAPPSGTSSPTSAAATTG